jgi:WD40 repeat protein
VAAGGNHGTFELVDPTTRSVTRQTILPTRYVFAIAYSPDGNSVLVGDLEGSADLIDARSGRVERTIPISPTGILALAWSPDAATIAVADETDTVRLIDPTNFNEIGPGYDLSPDELAQTTRTGIAHFPYLEFSPDGTTLYATDETGRVWVLPITVPEWEADACRVANRAFTTAEWEQVAPGRPYQPGCTTGARLP